MRSRRLPALLRTLLALLVCSAPAWAQDRGFRLHRYDGPTAGSWTFLVDRPWYSGTRYGALGITADYSRNPLVPRLATGRTEIGPIISDAILGHVDLAGSLFDRVVLSGSVPVTFLERGRTELVSQVGPIAGIAVGDPRVGVMVRLFGQTETDAFSMHLGGDAWVPIGAAATHQSDTAMRFRPRLVMAGAFGVARWTFDAGFLIRSYASLGPPALGMTAASEAQAGLAFGVSLFGDRLYLGPEAQFGMQVVGANAFATNGMNLEVLGGAHFLIADTILVGVAGGTGFLGAAGTPDLRGIARIAFAPRRSTTEETPKNQPRLVEDPASTDADLDGVSDADDRCPFEPETKNGIRDRDGCPEFAMEPGSPIARVLAPVANPPRSAPVEIAPTVIDAGAVAVTTPLDAGIDPVIAFVTADSDGDTVPDEADRCPVTKEDLDGFEDEDGCPELDNDDDGIADAKDQCAIEAETINEVKDDDGCPDTAPDADKDGVADKLDRCPLEPENLDGVRDDDGCPEFPQPAQLALARLLAPKPEHAMLLPPTTSSEDGVKAPAPADSDKDGIDDEADRCPITKEDLDGFEDEDGCPELDNDDDGVADKKDRCPEEAETINGSKDDDGCPDEVPDVDNDGVDYDDDRCPLEPGNSDDGCPHEPLPALALDGFPNAPKTPEQKLPDAPEPVATAATDFDKDAIADEADPCPMSAEDKDGFEDEDGCPELDNDHDGIEDAKDKCPFEAESINGKADVDGCPDPGEGAVVVEKKQVTIKGVIGFKSASATLQPAALPLLQQVASTLKAASTISLEIQGHTDDVGAAKKNIELSKRRAETIRQVLIKNGVSPKRLIATGFGPTRPRASNKTAAGREQNRRVEFLIIGEAK